MTQHEAREQIKAQVIAIRDKFSWVSARGNQNHSDPEVFQTYRDMMTQDDFLDEVTVVLAWLRVHASRKTINRNRGCYGWKHIVERHQQEAWLRAGNKPEIFGQALAYQYISENAFIVACLMNDINVWRHGSTTLVALSETATHYVPFEHDVLIAIPRCSDPSPAASTNHTASIVA